MTVTTSDAVPPNPADFRPHADPDANYSVHISASAPPAGDKIEPVRPVVTEAAKKSRMGRKKDPNRRRNYEINNAAWAYAKCSLLFFTALLVTWIPSSANRVYSVVKAQEINAPLETMSAFVLPLQGFWNAAIYAVTSWEACKSFWEDIKTGKRPEVMELVGGADPQEENKRHSRGIANFRPGNRSKGIDSESMTELNTRTPSADAHSSVETNSAYGRSST